MKTLQVRNASRNTEVAAAVRVADRWWARLVGLLGHSGLRHGEGLLLIPCRAVHMFGMRFPVDVAFVDPDGSVVAVYEGLRPGARTSRHRAAHSALEVCVGALAASATRVGDRLAWEEAG